MATVKGTWRFNDNIILPQENTGGALAGINIPFIMNLTIAGVDYSVSCSLIELYLNDIKFQFESASPLPPEELGISFPIKPWVYSANGGWYTDEYGEGIQTITIIGEQEVSEEFYTWFTENAKPVIKAGTYRWNDELTVLDSSKTHEIHIPFSVTLNLPNENFLSHTTKTENYNSLTVDLGNSIAYDGDDVVQGGYFYHGYKDRWESSYLGGTRQELSDALDVEYPDLDPVDKERYLDILALCYGEGIKIITVLEDTVVEDEAFATWFDTNTKEVKAISGKRRFKDTIASIPYEKYKIGAASSDMRQKFLDTYGIDIQPVAYNYDGFDITISRISPSVVMGDMYVDGIPTVLSEGVILGVSAEGYPTDNMWVETQLFANVTVDFGTEAQYIPVDAHDWIMENTDEVIAKKFTRLYIGNTVALSGGKCFKRLTTEVPYTVSGTWVFNEHPTTPDPKYLYSEVKFVSNGKTYLLMGRTWLSNSDELRYVYYSDTEEDYLADKVYEQGVDPEYYINGWADEAYRTVTFIGEQNMYGEFYEWFTKNAKPSITDLTGTTWYVPRLWEASAGYGVFDVNCTVTRVSSDLSYSGNIWVGHRIDSSYGDNYKTVEKSNCIIVHRESIGNSSDLYINIEGGTDATNPDLIAWLYANGELQT